MWQTGLEEGLPLIFSYFHKLNYQHIEIWLWPNGAIPTRIKGLTIFSFSLLHKKSKSLFFFVFFFNINKKHLFYTKWLQLHKLFKLIRTKLYLTVKYFLTIIYFSDFTPIPISAKNTEVI